jgi:hypothetical protein
MAEENQGAPDHLQAMKNISKSINQTMNSSMGEFRRTADSNNKSIVKIIRDLGTSILSQKKQLSALSESIEEVAETSNKIANKMDQMNSHLMDSINIQQEMLAQMKNVFGGIQAINSNWQQLSNGTNNTSIFGSIFNLLKGYAVPAAAIGGGLAAGGMAASYFGNKQEVVPNTSYSGQEKDAKLSAEKYLGRQMDDKEWKELVNATHAEAGQKNQTEVAMVMATMLNRAREKNKSVSDILREKSQFQSVTGTSANGNAPSQNFVQGPGEKRAEQIYGAATKILQQVDKNQKNFTAASAGAYGAGTNIGYRDKMIAAGGSTVGASVFNTAAPKVTGEVTTAPEKVETPTAAPQTAVPSAQPQAEPPQAEPQRKPEGHGGIISGPAQEAKEQQQSKDKGGLTTLQTRSGKSYQVASQYAEKFKGFVDELEATGYKIRSIGGYANRNIAGTNTKSWHAQGMAIDINPDANPVTYRGQPGAGKNDLPSNVGAIASKYGLGWGGNWKNKLDTMHFSFGSNEGGQGGSSGVGGGPNASNGDATAVDKSQEAPGAGGESGGGQQEQKSQSQLDGESLMGMVTSAYSQGSGGAGGMAGMMGGLGGVAGLSSNLMSGISSIEGMHDLSQKMNTLAGIPAPQPVLAPERPIPVETPAVSAPANEIEQNALQSQIEEYQQRQKAAEVSQKADQINERLSNTQQGEGNSIPGIDYNGSQDQEVISRWAERLGFGGSHFKEFDKIKLF